MIAAKWADHQPLHREQKMFERHGHRHLAQNYGGRMAQCAEPLDPLYQLMKKEMVTFFGSDRGKTAAVLRSFVASGERWAVEPFCLSSESSFAALSLVT